MLGSRGGRPSASGSGKIKVTRFSSPYLSIGRRAEGKFKGARTRGRKATGLPVRSNTAEMEHEDISRYTARNIGEASNFTEEGSGAEARGDEGREIDEGKDVVDSEEVVARVRIENEVEDKPSGSTGEGDDVSESAEDAGIGSDCERKVRVGENPCNADKEDPEMCWVEQVRGERFGSFLDCRDKVS